MTGYSITPESSIRDNWMDFILIYALSFSIAHRLNLCEGFHPLPSPAIIHFTLIIMVGILFQSRQNVKEVLGKKNWKKGEKHVSFNTFCTDLFNLPNLIAALLLHFKDTGVQVDTLTSHCCL